MTYILLIKLPFKIISYMTYILLIKLPFKIISYMIYILLLVNFYIEIPVGDIFVNKSSFMHYGTSARSFINSPMGLSMKQFLLKQLCNLTFKP